MCTINACVSKRSRSLSCPQPHLLVFGATGCGIVQCTKNEKKLEPAGTQCFFSVRAALTFSVAREVPETSAHA